MSGEDALFAHLRARQSLKSDEWVRSLDARKREEVEFHNFDRDRDDTEVIHAQAAIGVHANRKYYSITAECIAYVENWLRCHVPGKIFLDYACGEGTYAIRAATYGAAMSIGLDISDVSIRNARRAAAKARVDDICSFVQGDCEATELPDASVDVILCSGMLHHLDLNRAYPELRRIMRPGGRILAVEAFGHNPIIQLYRNLTPHLRTEWEKRHILRWRDIKRSKRWFSLGEVRHWHLFGLLAVPFRGTPLFQPILTGLYLVDSVALAIPGIRLMAWQVTFELRAAERPGPWPQQPNGTSSRTSTSCG
jgi:SAM-dependent methyltransferase